MAALRIVLQAGDEQVILVLEFGVQAGLVDAGGLLQILQAGAGKALGPEHGHGFVEHTLAAKSFLSSHSANYIGNAGRTRAATQAAGGFRNT